MSLLDRKNFDAANGWYTNGVRIAWFNRSLKLWTSYLVDADGNQCSETTYANSREDWATMESNGWFDWDKDRAELAQNIENDAYGH